MLFSYRIALCFKWLRGWFIAFNNHRKILTLSRQSLHKCIHTMASSASFTQNENKNVHAFHIFVLLLLQNIFIQSIYDRQKRKNALGIFLVPLIHITEYFVWFVEEDAIYRTSNRSQKHALDHVHTFLPKREWISSFENCFEVEGKTYWKWQ